MVEVGGVDWRTHVDINVNGTLVGAHSGGHTPSEMNIAASRKSSGDNGLIVEVWDPTDTGSQPRGKQDRNPNGTWSAEADDRRGGLEDRLRRTITLDTKPAGDDDAEVFINGVPVH